MIVISGGGLIGCNLAFLLAEKGIKVVVIEEHAQIGKPLHCAGLVSKKIRKIMRFPREIMVREFKEGVLVFPQGEVILKGKERALLLDREKLDHFFYEQALSHGARFFLKERVIGWKKGEGIEVMTNKRKIKGELLVGANGATSTVRKKLGIRVQLASAPQIRAKVECDGIKAIIDKRIATQFAWVISEEEGIAKVGLLSLSDYDFGLLKRKIGVKKVLGWCGGVIPFSKPLKATYDRVLLVGSSAAQSKALSGGGINVGLICSKIAAVAIERAEEEGDFSEKFFLAHYERAWRKEVGRDLKLAYFLARFLKELRNEEMDDVLKIVERISESISEAGDLDRYSKLFDRVKFSFPVLLFFLKQLFRRRLFLPLLFT